MSAYTAPTELPHRAAEGDRDRLTWEILQGTVDSYDATRRRDENVAYATILNRA